VVEVLPELVGQVLAIKAVWEVTQVLILLPQTVEVVGLVD
jgi:hypothetical protein